MPVKGYVFFFITGVRREVMSLPLEAGHSSLSFVETVFAKFNTGWAVREVTGW